MTRKCTFNKLLILALSFNIFTETASAQWSQIASMGTGPNDGCISFSLHGKGYVGGGSSGSKFYEYDTTANTWTMKGNAPGNKIRAFGFSFVANGKGYAGCGDTTGANNPTADMWMYNDTTNTWTQKASFPGGGRDAMFCFMINDTAYVGGGFAGTAGMSDFYKYNPFTDTWTALSALPMGAIGFPVSFVISNKGYVATGQVGSAESTGLWQYDPITNAWTTKASFPGAARQAAFGYALNNFGYVGGGMVGYTSVFNDMWRYNAITNTWSADQNFPSLYPAWSCVFTLGGTAYVGTGSYFTTGLVATDSFKRYRGVANPALGIVEANQNKYIELYPNPVNDYLTITGNVEPGAKISINDLTGREVKTVTFTGNNLYIGDLQKGTYILRCMNGNDVCTEKLVKQ